MPNVYKSGKANNAPHSVQQFIRICSLTLSCLGTQVFFYLGELDVALTYALGAGQLFDVNDKSEYVQTLLGELQAIQPALLLLVFLYIFSAPILMHKMNASNN